MKLNCNITAVVDSVIPIFKNFGFLLLKGNLEIPNVESLLLRMPPSVSKPNKYALKAELQFFYEVIRKSKEYVRF